MYQLFFLQIQSEEDSPYLIALGKGIGVAIIIFVIWIVRRWIRKSKDRNNNRHHQI